MKNTRSSVLPGLALTALVVLAQPAAFAQAHPAHAARRAAVPISVALGSAEAQETGGVPDQDVPDWVRAHFRRPIVRIGQDYALRTGERVREIQSVLGDVTLEGQVDYDVVVILGNIHLAKTAVIGGTLGVIGGSATIDEGASVGRDLVVIGGPLNAPPDFAAGDHQVVIGSPALGNALNGVVPWILRGLLWGRLIVPDLGWVWTVVGLMFLVYLVLNTLFDGPTRASADAILEKPLSTFFVGLLVLVLSVPAVVILAATVIGLVLVPFVLCAMLVAGLIGKAGVARAIGRRLVPQSSPDSRLQGIRSFLIGAIIITLAYMVPVLGLATWALTTVLGVGAAAIMLRRGLRREHPARERAVVAPPPPPVQPPSAPAVVREEVAPAPRAAEAPPADAATGSAGDMTLFPRATFLDRVVAFALDCILVGIAVQLFDLGRHDGGFPLLLLVYHVVFWAWKGTTVGGIVVGLRLIRTQGTDLRFADALVRALGSLLSLGALGIGCFWMLQDSERQMWHDKIAGTLVVKVPRSVVLA